MQAERTGNPAQVHDGPAQQERAEAMLSCAVQLSRASSSGTEGRAAVKAHHAKLRTPDLQPAATVVRLMHTGPCSRSEPHDSLRLWAATMHAACSELPTQAELQAALIQQPALLQAAHPMTAVMIVGGRRPLQKQHSTLNTAGTVDWALKAPHKPTCRQLGALRQAGWVRTKLPLLATCPSSS